MKAKNYELMLDIYKGILNPQNIKFKTEDFDTCELTFNILEDMITPYNLTDCIVRMLVNEQQQDCNIIDVNKGKVSIVLKQSMLKEGQNIAELQIYDALNQIRRLTTPCFNYNVSKSLMDDNTVQADANYTILQEMILEVSNANEVANNAKTVAEGALSTANQAQTKATEIMANGDYAKQQGDYAKAKGDEVANKITLNSLPQTNFNFIEREDSSMEKVVIGGKDIFFRGEKGEKGDAGTASVAINDTVTNTQQTWSSEKINNKIEEFYNINGIEYDFVDLISKKVSYDSMYVKKENSLGWVTVYLTQGSKHISWIIRNNIYDDFRILGDCFSGQLENIEVINDNKNYESATGTWVTTAPNTHYTTEVGATFTVKFNGNKVEFKHYADNRGGQWEFEILEVPLLEKKTISTYSQTVLSIRTQLIYDNLTNGEYTLKATFKGDDSTNIPSTGAGTSRGWVFVNGSNNNNTIRSYLKYKGNRRDLEHVVGFSNKEFAFNIKELDTFVPMHNNIGTAFYAEPAVIQVDGEDLDINTLTYPKKINTFNMTQTCYGRLSEGENYIKVTIYTTINANGIVGIEGKLEVLKNCLCNYGYYLMLPVSSNNVDRVVSSFGNSYQCTKVDGSKTLIGDQDTKNSKTYMFLKKGSDNVVAIRYNNFDLTTRKNGDYKESQPMFIEHRDTTMQKLYHRVFMAKPFTFGEIYRWSGDFVVANLKGFEKMF